MVSSSSRLGCFRGGLPILCTSGAAENTEAGQILPKLRKLRFRVLCLLDALARLALLLHGQCGQLLDNRLELPWNDCSPGS